MGKIVVVRFFFFCRVYEMNMNIYPPMKFHENVPYS